MYQISLRCMRPSASRDVNVDVSQRLEGKLQTVNLATQDDLLGHLDQGATAGIKSAARRSDACHLRIGSPGRLSTATATSAVRQRFLWGPALEEQRSRLRAANCVCSLVDASFFPCSCAAAVCAETPSRPPVVIQSAQNRQLSEIRSTSMIKPFFQFKTRVVTQGRCKRSPQVTR